MEKAEAEKMTVIKVRQVSVATRRLPFQAQCVMR